MIPKSKSNPATRRNTQKNARKKKPLLRPSERHAVYFHLAFTALAVLVLIAPIPLSMGWRMFLLLLVYNTSLPLIGRRLGHERWVDLWTFVLPLSVLQVFPDWFMSSVLGSLVFPDTGFPFIGTVGAYMALMWSIPLFVILFTVWRLRKRITPLSAYVLAVVLTIIVFGIAEATLWVIPIWYAAPHILAPLSVAIYVILGEAFLGVAAWYAYQTVADRNIPAKIIGALAVMLIYLGSISVAYLLIEHELRGVPGIPAESLEQFQNAQNDSEIGVPATESGNPAGEPPVEAAPTP